MPRTKRTSADGKRTIVNFDFGDRTYQIDPARRKVYRSFVEIETSRASVIYSEWRAQHATA